MRDVYLYNGAKSIPIDAFPEDAWTIVKGDYSGGGDNDGAKLYRAVSYIYRCVELRSGALASVPWAIKRGDNEVYVAGSDDAPAGLEWLDDLDELLRLTEAALCLVGAAYWYKATNRVRTRVQPSWLAPQTMRPMWDDDAGLVAFERRYKERRERFAPEEVVYFALPNPLHETEPGPAPAEAAALAAGVLYNGDQFIKGYFARGMIKATLLSVEGNPPQAEIEKLESWGKRVLAGIKNAWNMAAVRSTVKPIVIGEGLSDMSNHQLTEEKRQDIATAFGVPHSMVMSNAANFATAEADRLNFYDTTIIPQTRMVARVLNRQLFDGLGLQFVFKPQEMTLYQEDEDRRSTSLMHLVQAGMRLETAAEILGYEVPEGFTLRDPQPEPQPMMQDAPPGDDDGEGEQDEAREMEMRRFRTWAKRRMGKATFDPAQFGSDVLTDADKAAAVAELREAQASETAAHFPGDVYP